MEERAVKTIPQTGRPPSRRGSRGANSARRSDRGDRGHTDSIGSAYNLDLSNRRAAAVKAALVETYGIAPETTQGFGSPAASAECKMLERSTLDM